MSRTLSKTELMGLHHASVTKAHPLRLSKDSKTPAEREFVIASIVIGMEPDKVKLALFTRDCAEPIAIQTLVADDKTKDVAWHPAAIGRCQSPPVQSR